MAASVKLLTASRVVVCCLSQLTGAMCLLSCVFVQGVIVRWLASTVCVCEREWTGISAPSHPRWTWSVKRHRVLWAPCSVGSLPWHTHPVSAASPLATPQEDESNWTYGGIPSVVSVHGVRVLQLGSALPLQKPSVSVFHCHTIFLRETEAVKPKN